MKIAIISDIHDNLVNLGKCLHWCAKKKIKNIICCGDITNSETLKFLADNFKGIIYLVRGNIEIYDKGEIGRYDNIKYLGRAGKIELNGKTIGVCHEPAYIPKVISMEPSSGGGARCDIIFYGHTHKPWEEERDGVKIINPGTLGGMFTKATFAVYDTETETANLKILELLDVRQ